MYSVSPRASQNRALGRQCVVFVQATTKSKQVTDTFFYLQLAPLCPHANGRTRGALPSDQKSRSSLKIMHAGLSCIRVSNALLCILFEYTLPSRFVAFVSPALPLPSVQSSWPLAVLHALWTCCINITLTLSAMVLYTPYVDMYARGSTTNVFCFNSHHAGTSH